jgi:hypothetical protein
MIINNKAVEPFDYSFHHSLQSFLVSSDVVVNNNKDEDSNTKNISHNSKMNVGDHIG